MKEPLTGVAAKKLIRAIATTGTVAFPDHAKREMANDSLEQIDIENILRGGAVGEAEWENGSWRHQVFTARIVVVVAFRSESELVVVTAWRKKR